jgi:uncharacterized protein
VGKRVTALRAGTADKRPDRRSSAARRKEDSVMPRSVTVIAALSAWCVVLGLGGWPALRAEPGAPQELSDAAVVPTELRFLPDRPDLPAEPPSEQDLMDELRVDEEEADGDAEVIRERFPDGTVRIEREVTQDADGNYINHGKWRMWDARGNLVGEGRYRDHQRHGVWNRWFASGEVELLRQQPYNAFAGPFVSQATFINGNLHGKWTIYDSKLRKISEWEFVDGRRHGKSNWWFATGRKMREVDYRDGVIHGELLEWNQEGKLMLKENYDEGRKLAAKTTTHTSGQKRTEGMFLFARLVVESQDDWWNLKPATFTRQGQDQRHGLWTAWYPNGQKLLEGEYRHDTAVGKFTWWHANGQKAVHGSYEQGLQHGRWVWWHENGQKASEGQFEQGSRNGPWVWWNNDGKVSRKAHFSTTEREPSLAQPDRQEAQLEPPAMRIPLPLKR